MLDDPPVFEAVTAENFQQARDQAHADGFELFGAPEIEREPLVRVETADGGMYVGEQVALSWGVTTPPSWVQIRAVWACRKIIDNGEFV
jgi:hypothetical protein